MKRLLRLLKSEDGPTAVEYAVMLALVVGAAMVSINFFGQQTRASFLHTASEITNAVGGS